MASSPVDIANSAILKVGGSRINSFDDNKVEATVVSEFYERSIKFLFSQFYWGFASAIKQLALSPTAPLHEYTYAFALPEDVMRVQRVYPNCDYKVVGNQLHTNQPKLAIKYTRRVSEADIPIYFEQMMMYYLASQICVPITENATKDALNFDQYKYHLKQAKSLDSQQFPHDGFDDFPLDNVRY